MKFLKNYYYALIPMILPLIFTTVAYFLGNGNSFAIQRIIMVLIGGLIIAGIGTLQNISKKYRTQENE